MIDKLFKSKKELDLVAKNKILEIEIEKLKNEIRKKDGFLKCKNNLIIKKENSEKNWQKIEDGLKKYYNENNNLREEIKKYDLIFSNSNFKHNYLIPIEKYLFETKFKEIIVILNNKGKRYVQDLNEYVIEHLSIEESLKLNLKYKLQKFQNLEINWEIKTYLLNGEKISKIYMKYRKFTNILLNENIEFMSQLENYNFDKLINQGFLTDDILKLKEISLEYKSKYKIEKSYF